MIETDRLVLRPLQLTDQEALHRVLSDPRVVADWIDTNGQGFDERQTADYLDAQLQFWRDHGYGKWAVVPKTGGTLIGYCGLSPVDYLPEVEPAIEIGYRLTPSHWNMGYATEAAGAALAFGFDELGLDRIVAVHTSTNVASARVIRKLGMVPFRVVTYVSSKSGASAEMDVWEKCRSEPQDF